MKITFSAAGYMKTYFPEEKYSLDVEEGATLADFFNKLGETQGGELPRSVWNKEKNRFRGPAIIIIDGETVKEEAYLLSAGQHIAISKFIIGG